MFKIQENLCAVLSQIASGEACAHDKRTKREKERPERAASSDTQGNALGSELVGLSARARPQTRLFPHNLHQLNVCLIVSEVPIPKKSSGKKILTLLKVCILFSIF